MWTLLRPFFAICLALILATTSLSMAVARGQTRVAGEIVLCTGAGATSVAVDANGQPVGPVHLCPDMVLGLMAALDLAAPLFARPEGISAVDFSSLSQPSIPFAAPASTARDPPSLV